MIRKAFLPEHLTAYLFIALGLLGISHHEIWLDEMHHWVMARDSDSLAELYHNARYDGHPLLWDIFLFIITRFTHNPFGMQLLNLFIASTAAILVLKYAPFSLVKRILLVFGYFFFYEYTVISRNYSLGLLLIICCCILFRNRSSHYLKLSILLGALANTHLLCLIVSLGFFLALVYDYFFYQRFQDQQKHIAYVSVFIYSALLFVAVVQIAPPADSRFTITSLKEFSFHRLGSAPSILTKGFLPIPELNNLSWWNTNFFAALSPVVNALLAIIIFIAPFIIFFKKSSALIIFYVTAIGTMLFIFLFQVSAARYYGFVFFSFIAGLWISHENEIELRPGFNGLIKSLQQMITKPFIYSVLIIQVIAGGIAWGIDFTKPFSQAGNTVRYLKSDHLFSELIAVSPCNAGPPISGYLDQKVFYPQINEWGSFCKWNFPFEKVGIDSVLAHVENLRRNQHRNVIMILNEAPAELSLSTNHIYNQNEEVNIQFLKEFTGSTVKSENYFIYRVSVNTSK